MQFVVPQRVAKISDDGAFAFVEDSSTGLPIGELVLQDKPAPVKISAKTKSHPAADRTA
jgi:hypothetical protein